MIKNINTIAVFDLDGTITSKDTYLEFIKFCKGTLFFYLGIVVLSPFIILFYLKLYNNNRLKECFFSFFFKGYKASELKKKGVEFSETILPALCYKSALNVLKWHQEQEHDIIILTASSDIWLKQWCASNNYELKSTQFETIDDCFTGKIKGNNCFGIEKRTFLTEYLKNKNYAFSYGYGDSSSDKHFLELTNQSYLMKLDSDNVDKYWKNEHL
ncbi:HAD-IB family hydrolase [Flavivirga spongiicola]|uniref:HAD-IB family hydrolase n=1 Tax=Flavivirga spongiicola TaxID=421621 RepID=A0ABU7XYG7_9FLAO|nr:HAD-IB family hydrolase [Flavivirga sp. MEBiC05379]MDO5980493.1 HAD-IB family hydrolase [Flavivirga sp. MEBiC05379]